MMLRPFPNLRSVAQLVAAPTQGLMQACILCCQQSAATWVGPVGWIAANLCYQFAGTLSWTKAAGGLQKSERPA
jgi:hypothetical protein